MEDLTGPIKEYEEQFLGEDPSPGTSANGLLSPPSSCGGSRGSSPASPVTSSPRPTSSSQNKPHRQRQRQQQQVRPATNKRRRRRRRLGCVHYSGLMSLLWCFAWTMLALHNQHRDPARQKMGDSSNITSTSANDAILGSYQHLLSPKWLSTTGTTTTASDEKSSNTEEATSFFSSLWESSSISSSSTQQEDDEEVMILPKWMEEYFEWHHEQRQQLELLHTENNGGRDWLTNHNHNSTSHYNFLIMRCLAVDDKCGGASDRLQSLPFAILVASQLRRILLIKWERPHPLEHFLQVPVPSPTASPQSSLRRPPPLDWRVPEWMNHYIQHRRVPHITTTAHAKRYVNDYYDSTSKHSNGMSATTTPTIQFLEMRHQSHDHGRRYYDEYSLGRNQPSFPAIYSKVWNTVFVPSTNVQLLIDKRFEQLHLVPFNYVALHIRSMYTRNRFSTNMIRNAVQCASSLSSMSSSVSSMPTATRTTTTTTIMPILVASDNLQIAHRAVEWANSNGRTAVIAQEQEENEIGDNSKTDTNTSTNPTKTLHLDRGTNFLSRDNPDWMDHAPHKYYDIFVDLYLLAYSQCVSYDLGGFGKWGSLLGGNVNCTINHALHNCNWDGIIIEDDKDGKDNDNNNATTSTTNSTILDTPSTNAT